MTIVKSKVGLYTHFHFPSVNAGRSLLIELPHGATKSKDFIYYLDRLQGSYPADLIDFFHVNTDVGSPEIAFDIARQLQGQYEVHVLQSHIPRTFIDCNRVVGEDISYKEGGVTPATASYVEDERDLRTLYEVYEQYRSYVQALYAKICGEQQGFGLMLHTYAPRSVPIQAVNQDIVNQLRAFYDTEKIFDCKLRPEIDVIYKTPENEELSNLIWRRKLVEECTKIGLEVADGTSYPLHPVTMAYSYAKVYPGQTLCVEIRRDLVVEIWEPFSEMSIAKEKSEMLAACLVRSLF